MPLLRPPFYAQQRDSSWLATQAPIRIGIYRSGVVLLYTSLI